MRPSDPLAIGEKAAWTGARFKDNGTARRLVVRVPNLRHLEKADFKDLTDRLRATAARYSHYPSSEQAA